MADLDVVVVGAGFAGIYAVRAFEAGSGVGIQVAPEIAAVAAHLTVFQRTANFAVPNRNAPVDADWERSFKGTACGT